MASRDGVMKALFAAFLEGLKAALRSSSSTTTKKRAPSSSSRSGTQRATGTTKTTRPAYVGDAEGAVTLEYAPFADDQPDPGEIVWAWVPFEEDHTQGKDRPVLVVGRQRKHLLALMLTSKDHEKDRADEARWGRSWVDIGTGDWDAQRRPSEVRVDRVLRLDPAVVRRQGATLDRKRFEKVAEGVQAARR